LPQGFLAQIATALVEGDTPGVTTPLSELVSRLARLAAPRTYLMTARLLEEQDEIELKAVCDDSGPNREFVRHVTFSALDHLGAAAIAKGFARDARAALSRTSAPAVRDSTHKG
jgi:hypothetical protein